MSLWTPSEITTDLWLDANDASTITVETGVSEWRDKSGNGRHAYQTATSKQPAVLASGLNGLSTLLFDGTSDKLYLPSWVTPRQSWFIVSKQGSTTSTRVLARRGAATYSHIIRYQNSDSVLVAFTASTNVSLVFDAPGNVHLIASIYDGANIHGYLHGDLKGSAALTGDLVVSVTAGSDGTNNIGGNTDPSGYHDESLAEVVVLPVAADTETRQNIEGYLAWKWGTQAELPAGHPYLLAAPILGTPGVSAARPVVFICT